MLSLSLCRHAPKHYCHCNRCRTLFHSAPHLLSSHHTASPNCVFYLLQFILAHRCSPSSQILPSDACMSSSVSSLLCKLRMSDGSDSDFNSVFHVPTSATPVSGKPLHACTITLYCKPSKQWAYVYDCFDPPAPFPKQHLRLCRHFMVLISLHARVEYQAVHRLSLLKRRFDWCSEQSKQELPYLEGQE